jgi:hydrogenase nickel incorporation protein HypA/HybF
MHELSLCQSIYTVVDRARGDRRVHAVNLRIGQLRQVVPETLTFCWGVVTEDGPLNGAELVVDQVPAEIACRACGARSVLDEVMLVCPACGAVTVDVVSGEEFLVTSLDLVPEG